MKTGIIWDLDGTLLDTLEDLKDATNYALTTHGFPPRTLAEIRRFVGNGAAKLIGRALGEENAASLETVLATFRQYYGDHSRDKTRPYAGIPEVLAALGEKYPMAVVSNKPDSNVKSLCAVYFPGIYAMGDAPDLPRKPAPDMVYKAMAAIGVDTCIYVGDSEVDVLTARNAGAKCLSVLWGFRDREDMEAAGGNCFCEKPEELPEIIDEMVHK